MLGKPQAALLASSATPLPWRELALHAQTELLLCLPGGETSLQPTEGPPSQLCLRELSMSPGPGTVACASLWHPQLCGRQVPGGDSQLLRRETVLGSYS